MEYFFKRGERVTVEPAEMSASASVYGTNPVHANSRGAVVREIPATARVLYPRVLVKLDNGKRKIVDKATLHFDDWEG